MFLQLSLNNIPITIQNVTKYLVIHIDKRITCTTYQKQNNHKNNTLFFFLICIFRLVMSWYLSNNARHKDLQMSTVNETAIRKYEHFYSKLNLNQNLIIYRMSLIAIPNNLQSTLKRK